MNLRVISYNIHKGFNFTNAQFILRELKEMLRFRRADILFLQEVIGQNDLYHQSLKAWPSEGQFEYLADTVWPHFSYGKNAVKEGHHHGNAILSQFPITFYENIDISTNRLERRGLLHCTIKVKGVTLDLFNVHLNLTQKGRLAQLPFIEKRHLLERRGDALILAGDFNDWSGRITREIEAKLGVNEVFKTLHGRSARSYPSFFPVLSLDKVFCDNIEIVGARVLHSGRWKKLSDHLPLEVDFRI